MSGISTQDESTLLRVKAYLREKHVDHITWHITLNNTMTTRPKMHGGSVVPSITQAKQFRRSVEPGSASQCWECTLRLPCTFSSADDKELVAVGHGVTKDEASEDVCCTAMAKLFCADASNIVLRPKHWNVSLPALLEGLCEVMDFGGAGVAHQPLAVHVRPAGGGEMGAAMTPEQKTEAVAVVIRACLEGHGGSFDPSRIARKWVQLPDQEKHPWRILDDLLLPGELRDFIDAHPEFQWRPNSDGKGMIISWADGRRCANPVEQPQLALPSGASSNSAGEPAVGHGAPSIFWPALTNELVNAGWRSFLYGDDEWIWFHNQNTQTVSWYHPRTGDACFRRDGEYVSVPACEAGPPPLIRLSGGASDSQGPGSASPVERATLKDQALPVQALPVQATSGATKDGECKSQDVAASPKSGGTCESESVDGLAVRSAAAHQCAGLEALRGQPVSGASSSSAGEPAVGHGASAVMKSLPIGASSSSVDGPAPGSAAAHECAAWDAID